MRKLVIGVKESVLIFMLLLFCPAVCLVSCDSEDDNSGADSSTDKRREPYFVEVTKVQQVTRDEIARSLATLLPDVDFNSNPLFSSILCDLDVVSIIYRTTGVDGGTVEASGVVVMRSGTTSYDHLLSWQHGTLDLEEAPSLQGFYYEMAPVLMGHVVVMADYLGYGASRTEDRQTPYLHLKITGTACADMIEAAREYLQGRGIVQNSDNLQLAGYSQGGQATLATLMELERRGKAEQVQKVWVGAGPYDLVNTLTLFIDMGNSHYPRTGYIPYILRGIAYGEQKVLNDSNLYSSRVMDEQLYKMFSTTPLSTWHSRLGSDISAVVNPDFYDYPTFNGNADMLWLSDALRDNSIINQPVPITPVILFHSPTDDFVPYANAESLSQQWDCDLVVLESDGHVNGGVEFFLRYLGLWEIVKNLLP